MVYISPDHRGVLSMAKKGPLSKVETYYIEHNHSKISVQEIATDLDRPVSAVEKFIKKIKSDRVTNVKSTVISEQFARQSGAVVMTENASTMIQDSKRNRPPSKANTNHCVTQIRSND